MFFRVKALVLAVFFTVVCAADQESFWSRLLPNVVQHSAMSGVSGGSLPNGSKAKFDVEVTKEGGVLTAHGKSTSGAVPFVFDVQVNRDGSVVISSGFEPKDQGCRVNDGMDLQAQVRLIRNVILAAHQTPVTLYSRATPTSNIRVVRQGWPLYGDVFNKIDVAMRKGAVTVKPDEQACPRETLQQFRRELKKVGVKV